MKIFWFRVFSSVYVHMRCVIFEIYIYTCELCTCMIFKCIKNMIYLCKIFEYFFYFNCLCFRLFLFESIQKHKSKDEVRRLQEIHNYIKLHKIFKDYKNLEQTKKNSLLIQRNSKELRIFIFFSFKGNTHIRSNVFLSNLIFWFCICNFFNVAKYCYAK